MNNVHQVKVLEPPERTVPTKFKEIQKTIQNWLQQNYDNFFVFKATALNFCNVSANKMYLQT